MHHQLQVPLAGLGAPSNPASINPPSAPRTPSRSSDKFSLNQLPNQF